MLVLDPFELHLKAVRLPQHREESDRVRLGSFALASLS